MFRCLSFNSISMQYHGYGAYIYVLEIIILFESSLRCPYFEPSSCKIRILCPCSKIAELETELICVCRGKQKSRSSKTYVLKHSNSTTNKYEASLSNIFYSMFRLRKKQAIPCIIYEKCPGKLQLGYYFLLELQSVYYSGFNAIFLLWYSSLLTFEFMEDAMGIFKRRRRLPTTRYHGLC